MADVQLTASVRTQLDAVRSIQRTYDRKSEELATNRKDDDEKSQRLADYVAQQLSNRASDLLAIKDAIGQGASKSLVAQSGLRSIDKSLDQLKSLALQYENTSDPAIQAKLQTQFDALSQQVDNFARDSSFGGTQLISATPDDLTIPLSDKSSITIKGQASDSASLNLDITDVASIDTAKAQIRAAEQSIGADAATLNIRENFTDKLVNGLQEGAAKLVEVDLNEVAAESISAATRSALSAEALALSAKSGRSILQLF
jgi:flagellin-like hook-associated protein FlgL